MPSVAILGATGYTGRELAHLLLQHPELDLEHVTTTSRAGVALAAVHPALGGRTDLVLESFTPTIAQGVDLLFSCSPHHHSMGAIAEAFDANPDLKVVDLSGDFRLPDAGVYADVYGTQHTAPQLLAEAVYGLPELNRQAIAKARLVANPGCYPTSAILPLAPLQQAGHLKEAIIDSVSGHSGAGVQPSTRSHLPNAEGSVHAYKVGGHRHEPEIATHLGAPVTFTPHLVPMERGIHTTAHAFLQHHLTGDEVAALFEEAYGNEPFVRILTDATPDTKHVAHTNFVDLAWHLKGDRLILLSALDNLVKGAAGQALQNANILLGLPETQGFLLPRKQKVTA